MGRLTTSEDEREGRKVESEKGGRAAGFLCAEEEQRREQRPSFSVIFNDSNVSTIKEIFACRRHDHWVPFSNCRKRDFWQDTGMDFHRTDSSKRSEVDQQSRTCSVDGMDYRGVHETQGNTSNGERFIECVPSYHLNPSEWEDLVDFIECSPGKDYGSWLKNLNKFNKWKQEKSAIFKSQKKKKRTYIKKIYNLRSRVDASESNEVKSPDQRSRTEGCMKQCL